MEVNKGRNCYNCGEFGHIARHYKNWRFVTQEKRMEYGNNHKADNLKEEENLVVFN